MVLPGSRVLTLSLAQWIFVSKWGYDHRVSKWDYKYRVFNPLSRVSIKLPALEKLRPKSRLSVELDRLKRLWGRSPIIHRIALSTSPSSSWSYTIMVTICRDLRPQGYAFHRSGEDAWTEGTQEEVKSLGNATLFLNGNPEISVEFNAQTCLPGIKPNRIYFTEYVDKKMYCYCMEDGKVETCSDAPDFYEAEWIPPVSFNFLRYPGQQSLDMDISETDSSTHTSSSGAERTITKWVRLHQLLLSGYSPICSNPDANQEIRSLPDFQVKQQQLEAYEMTANNHWEKKNELLRAQEVMESHRANDDTILRSLAAQEKMVN
ncbi:hypothetical protein NL676_008748 [Syzygium grande]|nr:hypothetical protein NL676_008748 [Syzygium grande]